MDTMTLRRSHLFLLGLGVLSPPNAVAASQPIAGILAGAAQVASPASAKESSVLETAERAAKATEAWELTGGSAFFEGESQAADLRKANEGLSGYLKDHPGDVRALLLRARLLRALIVVTPVAIQLDDSGTGQVTQGDMTSVRSDALAAIEKVLESDPENAEAYYWKGRTLMLSNRAAQQVGAEAELDPAPAVDAVRTAVRLAPGNQSYREYLALALFGSGHTAEALQELGKLPGKHPILQLMDDLEAVPAPPGAKPNDQMPDPSQIFAGHMDVFRYAGLRTKGYAVSSPLAEVQAFYSRAWPGLRWVKSGESRTPASGLRWREGTLEPMPDPAPFNDMEKELPPSGVLMLLSRDEETPGRTLVFIINFRRF